MCPAAKYALLPAGHAGPALQGAAVAWGGQGRSPLRTLSLRASPRREASALGVQTGAAIRFQRGNAALTGRRGRRPLHTLSLRASPRREASALGVQTGAAIRFPALAPLDKPVGMGIIVDVRGRCDKRSAPLRENFNEPYGSQKPSPARVAVFVFQLHNTNRNGIPPDVESKYPVHVCHPLSGL